jgi:hypothetical protein
MNEVNMDESYLNNIFDDSFKGNLNRFIEIMIRDWCCTTSGMVNTRPCGRGT